MSHMSPKWLVHTDQVGRVFSEAVSKVKSIYKEAYPLASRSTSYKKLSSALDSLGPMTIRNWNECEVNEVLECCYWNGKKIKTSIPEFGAHKYASNALTSFFKAVFILLWGRRQVILPLDFTLPVNQDVVLDKVTKECGSNALEFARSVSLTSGIIYSGVMGKQERLLRANSWYRVLLSTTIYNPDDLTKEDTRELYWASVGARGSLLQRYYIKDFLTTLGQLGSKASDVKFFFESEYDSKIAAKAMETQFYSKLQEISRETTLSEHTLLFLESTNCTVEQLADHYSNTALVRNSFALSDAADGSQVQMPPGYKYVDEEVKNICLLLKSVFDKFSRANPCQNQKNRKAALNYALCYCALYLSAFYKLRDGGLDNYPKTLNDLFDPTHFTVDDELLDGVATYRVKPPQTFLQYFDIVTAINKWGAETRNQRVRVIEDLHEYIETNNRLLPDADKVKNAFNKSHYARIKGRSGTVKKSIPRAYFATFIDMLYSLEYLVMHLNEMAAGEIPGVKNDELTIANASELASDPHWTGVWGRGELSCQAVDQSLLNYCPVFYHDGKVRSFEYIPRFYRIIDMVLAKKSNDSVVVVNEQRVITNDIRLTQLMCETGIRQHHLIWLDRDAYDKYFDENSRRPLAPLYVSTDKAHGPWSAIVSRHVMGLLERQRNWYDCCADPSYEDPLWYGGQEGSGFGEMKPLFRTPQSLGSWTNYRSFRLLLVLMQYFIRKQLGDFKTRELVVLARGKGLPNSFVGNFNIEALSSVPQQKLTSDITPHGLRAGFVSEAIKFLPPSLVGKYFTGQSENQVYYYLLLHDEEELSHDEILCEVLMRNQKRLADGVAPLMADAIFKLNQRLRKSIVSDPEKAISTNRLMSLSRIKNGPDGLDLIRAKDVTDFAFNATHICPFNNICPKEVVHMLGEASACALCPYAIRGVDHIPAIGAQKDKYKELMVGILSMIQELLRRKPEQRSEAEMERMEREHDHYARQAVMLEALELQLIEMASSGKHNALMARNKQEIIGHYKKVELDSHSKLLKRIIDVQNFPDLTSPELDCRLSLLRGNLLMYKGDVREHLKIDGSVEFTPASKAATLISSLVRSEAMTTMEVYKVCAAAEDLYKIDTQPASVISDFLSVKVLN
ncbi:hypothetical protein [Pseudomonas alloputida]|uniref:hypothetical protein n=1 Tax=Pseudomonas alloputida TaxID=1940621 RepID=UPI00386E722F